MKKILGWSISSGITVLLIVWASGFDFHRGPELGGLFGAIVIISLAVAGVASL